MEIKYPDNTGDTYVSYFRNREGPNAILVYYKNISRFVSTSKQLRAVFGPAKFTDSVKALSAWADEQIAKYNDESKSSLDQTRIIAEGFGPKIYTD